jgi:DNA-binding PadR family transcriptional regulator
MERKGWVESEWGLSDNNRRAKYYQLTDEGREALHSERTAWARYVEAVGRVFESPAPSEA